MSQYIIHSVLKHSLPVGTRVEDVRRNYVYTKSEMEYSTGRYANGGTSVVVYFKPTEKPLDKTQTPDPYYAKILVDSIPLRGNRPAYIKQQLKKWFSDFLITISDSELNKATYGALEAATPAINERLSTVDSKPQHPGYYSPNLKHSSEDVDVIDCTFNQDNEPDYLSVKMSDIDDNYLEHAANPYPYRPDVKLDGNQLVITFTDVTNNRTATLSVNLVGAKNYKDVEDRLDNLLQAAYADGKDWGNISKNAFDSIMRQARALNIFNDKTVSNRYRRNKSSN